MDDPISDGMNAAANLLNTDQGRNLLNPVTQEIGLLLADLVGAFRFCVEENWARFYPKWARQRQNRPLTLDEIRKVVPLLQAASLCSDDELQERWAALLESSVTTPEGVLPSFGHTLSQLTAEEAKFLERLYQKDRNGLGEFESLTRIYDPEWQQLFFADRERYNMQIDHVRLLVQDLERLGLLVAEQRVKEVKKNIRRLDELPSLLEKLGQQKLDSVYHISHYGKNFINAVTPKGQATGDTNP